jgi:uncharacterized protein (TIGR02145 family)
LIKTNTMGLFSFFKEWKLSGDGKDIFIDPRDGEKYRTVKIRNQIWMAENFRYNSHEYKKGYVWNYGGDKERIRQYGCLYSWNPAKEWAPEGWHLPTKEEYSDMIFFVTENRSNALELLRKGGSSKFDAVFGGMYNELYTPDGIGQSAFYWTSQPKYDWVKDEHYYLCLISSEGKYGFDTMYTSQLFSVRYVKNAI